MGNEETGGGGPQQERQERRESARREPSPEASRILGGSVDPTLWNRKITEREKEATARGLRELRKIDLRPQARALVAEETEKRMREAPEGRYAEYREWITAAEKKIRWYRRHRGETESYPKKYLEEVNEALDILIPPRGKREGTGMEQEESEAEYLFRRYINSQSVAYPKYHEKFYEQAAGKSEDRGALEEAIEGRRREFIKKMIQVSRKADGEIDIGHLRAMLTGLGGIIGSKALLFATMAEGYLEEGREQGEVGRERLVREVIAGLGQEPAAENRPIFEKFAHYAKEAQEEDRLRQRKGERLTKQETLPLLPGEEGGPSPQEAASTLLKGTVGAVLDPIQGESVGMIDRTKGGEKISTVGQRALFPYMILPAVMTETFIDEVENKFGIPPRREGAMVNLMRSQDILFVMTGKRNNAFVVQGGGNFGDSDHSGRKGSTTFTLAFETERAQQYFLKWLEKNPHEALYSTFLPLHPPGTYDYQGFTQAEVVSKKFKGIHEIRVEDEDVGREYYERNSSGEMMPIEEAMASKIQSVAMVGRFPNGATLPAAEFAPAPNLCIIQDRRLSSGFTGDMAYKVLSFRNLLQQHGGSLAMEIQPYDPETGLRQEDHPAYLAFGFMQEIEGDKEPLILACAFSPAEAKQFMQLIKQSPEGATIVKRFLRHVKPDLFTENSQMNIENPQKLFVLDEEAQFDIFGLGENRAFITRFGAFQKDAASNESHLQEYKARIATAKENLRNQSFTDQYITTHVYKEEIAIGAAQEQEALEEVREKLAKEAIAGETGDREILARLESGEISEAELPRLAAEVARQIRGKGMGFLESKFPVPLDPISDKQGSGWRELYGFSSDPSINVGSDRGMIDAFSGKIFGRNEAIHDTEISGIVKEGKQALIITPLGMTIRRNLGTGPSERRRKDPGPGRENWVEYDFSTEIFSNRDIRHVYLAMSMGVPPEVAEVLDKAITSHPLFMDNLVSALYPKLVGTDFRTNMDIAPATELMIQDFRTGESDLDSVAHNPPEPRVVQYPHVAGTHRQALFDKISTTDDEVKGLEAAREYLRSVLIEYDDNLDYSAGLVQAFHKGVLRVGTVTQMKEQIARAVANEQYGQLSAADRTSLTAFLEIFTAASNEEITIINTNPRATTTSARLQLSERSIQRLVNRLKQYQGTSDTIAYIIRSFSPAEDSQETLLQRIKITGVAAGLTGSEETLQEMAFNLIGQYITEDNEPEARPLVDEGGPDDLAIDQETRARIADIFGSITNRAFWGKVRLDGRPLPPAGHLPAIRVPDRRRLTGLVGDTDYKALGEAKLAADTSSIAIGYVKNIDHFFQKEWAADKRLFNSRPGHFITHVSILESNNDMVDFIFFDPTLTEGREIGLTHISCEMPKNRARELITLIQGDKNKGIPPTPDAAELYYRKISAGLEVPDDGPARVTRVKTPFIGILDTKKFLELQPKSITDYAGIDSALKSATTSLAYSQSFGSI